MHRSARRLAQAAIRPRVSEIEPTPYAWVNPNQARDTSGGWWIGGMQRCIDNRAISREEHRGEGEHIVCICTHFSLISDTQRYAAHARVKAR